MDTKAALDMLKSMKAQLLSEAAGKTAQADAIDVSISQLEGTLTTQLVELESTKVVLEKAQTKIKDLGGEPVDAEVILGGVK